MSLDISLQTAEECLRISHILQGHNQSLLVEKEGVVKKVETAKKWLAKQPDYLKFLQHLQSVLHQKNIGAFSELLSYFVKDVLKKDKDIIFDLYTYQNLPALKIEALNDGCRESIYEGSGGSIANIVSTGLRLIALSRLQHRKFIVLDEPDCWLKPDHVPIFAKIIGEISEKLKLQTIIISHHDWKYFKDYGRVIELVSDGKNLEANIVHDTEVESDLSNTDYIKSIRLRQFMSHQDTEFKLHPYLTCIIGENDIGKSVLSTAIKSVCYNDSSDSYIKHHTEEAQVLFELSSNRQVLWQRFKTTTQDNPQKVKYSLFVDNALITSEFNSSDVPKFISKELNILMTEDIDIHIGNQKQPVFLLSSDVKPKERAKILSLGKESLLIQKMMERIKIKTRQNKQSVKEGEERYEILNKQLQVLLNIDSLVDKAEDAKSEYFRLNKQKESVLNLNQTIYELNEVVNIAKIEKCIVNIDDIKLRDCEPLIDIIASLDVQQKISEINYINYSIKEINLLDTVDLDRMIKRLKFSEQAASIPLIDLSIDEPIIHNVIELTEIINKLIESNKLNEIELIDYSVIKEIKLKDTTELSLLIDAMIREEELLKDYEMKKGNLLVWEKTINKEIEDFLKENKGICPTCHQSVSLSHLIGEGHD